MEIGIIGAGAAAVGLLDALPPGTAEAVTVFDPARLPWRGRPYQPDLDSVRVNVTPEISSIRFRDGGHYVRWLGERGAVHMDRLLGRPLVPRGVFGGYLEDTARAALTKFGRARVVRAAVTGVSAGERLTLTTGDGRRHEVDRVVLCVGGGAPLDHYGLTGTPGFVPDPYPLERTLADVPAGGDVAVLGSGLTAVDIVVSLAARGHTGRISLVSRSGALPYVWQRPREIELRHLTFERVRALTGPVTLDALAGLMRAELAEHGEDWDELAARIAADARSADTAGILRRGVDEVDSPAVGRQILRITAHGLAPRVWRMLPGADRRLLRERHFRTAVGLASPMVPVNAAALLDLFDSGQLEAVRGIQKIEPGRGARGGFRLAHAAGERTADVVINAVNPPPHAVPRTAEPLVTALLAAGAALDPSGGLRTDPSTGRLLVGGRPDPRVHVVGDLAGGGSFVTSGIPAVAARAHLAAASLAR
ncbi:FAD/NAD(P)-binding protein [Actinomadura rugatobispora]|uniref:FAD/NAD(P)-binding protein n=1 Tax=Actinomadura rugatobispora TaxID=1994 RepID=A0ABW1A044_9ACTN